MYGGIMFARIKVREILEERKKFHAYRMFGGLSVENR